MWKSIKRKAINRREFVYIDKISMSKWSNERWKQWLIQTTITLNPRIISVKIRLWQGKNIFTSSKVRKEKKLKVFWLSDDFVIVPLFIAISIAIQCLMCSSARTISIFRGPTTVSTIQLNRWMCVQKHTALWTRLFNQTFSSCGSD